MLIGRYASATTSRARLMIAVRSLRVYRDQRSRSGVMAFLKPLDVFDMLSSLPPPLVVAFPTLHPAVSWTSARIDNYRIMTSTHWKLTCGESQPTGHSGDAFCPS